jgi:hypothetical protein
MRLPAGVVAYTAWAPVDAPQARRLSIELLTQPRALPPAQS